MEHDFKRTSIFDSKNIGETTLSLIMPFRKSTPHEALQAVYNKIFIDLQKTFIGIGKVSVCRDVENKVTVHVKVEHTHSISFIMKLVSGCFRHCIKMELPLYLYSQKTDIFIRIKKIMDQSGTSISIKICKKVEVYICGRIEECLNVRMEIFEMIEKMAGRSVENKKTVVPVQSAVEKGQRVFYRSRINSEDCLVSCEDKNLIGSKDSAIADKIQQYFEKLVLDAQKMMYLLHYKAIEIESILAYNQSYMDTNDNDKSHVDVTLRGFSAHDVMMARNGIDLLYNEIMKLVISDVDSFSSEEAIVFEVADTRQFLVIGEKKYLMSMLDEGYVEGEIDVDTDTIDFLCGKKNGKIVKIMRDVDCNIKIQKRESSTRICITISGRCRNFVRALEMIEEEFPEELTFHIDEKHHKRIIGYGGKNIQKIMKKHGVYIKFMSDKERRRVGHTDNVLMKTPRKNACNLSTMKQEVMALIEEFDEELTEFQTRISFSEFYDFEPSKFRLAFEGVLVNEIEMVIPCNYYIEDEDWRMRHSTDDTRHYNTNHINRVDEHNLQRFRIQNKGPWIVKSSETLCLEKITAMHWIGNVECMPMFSWLFKYAYNVFPMCNRNDAKEQDAGEDEKIMLI
ncbi:hypothetical protein CWI42_070530 [Ordospora colligata]|uniref:K Homology domain-containing protein n=1 Tax=Ordospora colligata OC4 TaxID=1354746 RepID=A0A0B2UKE8_9MICR|nr:uncharacterized protein M896_070530 [Ordospora colligata OC4]KHN69485.1 hypothetical protein M896_070530 [Ordospora colligata OC4]TBU15229.1 hypothetical protein CWI41_070530 [Ordospora colligata]TBU15300.1 hypothetical protein CWI40_070530 [Ordospora colligata]TBU18482.1 hypothetical protein CWI42_070530 [Ordospora colligata]